MKTLLFIFLIISNAFAGDCSPTNLITEPNSPFQKIPVYDQDGTDICYAYVASQLIDYYEIKNGASGSNVHPLWASVKYSESINRKVVSTGVAANAIEVLKQTGICDKNKVSEALRMWTEKANITEAQAIDAFERYVISIGRAENTLKEKNPDSRLSESEMDLILKASLKETKLYCSSGSSLEQLVPDLHALVTMSSTDLFSRLMLPQCQGTLKKPKVPKPKYQLRYQDGTTASLLEEKLDETKGPVALQYCSQFLKLPGHVGLKRPEKPGKNELLEDCHGHESLIVGKKMIGNQCHFLLRNTWGSGFNQYTKHWKCLCKNKVTGQFVDDCKQETHNNGKYTVEGCWIDAGNIDKNGVAVTSMEGPSI